MGENSWCVIGVCNNDKRYPQHYVKQSNVKGDTIIHALPKDETVRKTWVQQILKGIKDFQSEKDIRNSFFVCLNHFFDGRPTKSNPSTSFFLTVSTNTVPAPKPRESPQKPLTNLYKALPHKTKNSKKRLDFFDENFSTGQSGLIGEEYIENDNDTLEPVLGEINVDECNDEQSFSRDIGIITESNEALSIPMLFAHMTIEAVVSRFRRIEGPEIFKGIFEILKPKAPVLKNCD